MGCSRTDRRWADQLRPRFPCHVPARGAPCGPDFQRLQARRASRRAIDEVRASHQPQDRQGTRADNSTDVTSAGDHSNRVTRARRRARRAPGGSAHRGMRCSGQHGGAATGESRWLDGESFEIPDLTTSDVHPNGPPARVQRDSFHQQLVFAEDRVAGVARFAVAWSTPDRSDAVMRQATVWSLRRMKSGDLLRSAWLSQHAEASYAAVFQEPAAPNDAVATPSNRSSPA
jgi:hypothetical protein